MNIVQFNEGNASGMIVINSFDKLIISYADDENTVCCKECIRRRFITTRKDRANIESHIDDSCEVIFSTAVSVLTELLRNDAGLVDELNRRKAFILDKNDLSLSWEYVTPVPTCKTCGRLPDDTQELSDAAGKKVYDLIHGSESVPFRSRDCIALAKDIEKVALSKNFGFITTLLDNYDGPFPIAVAMLPLCDGRDEPGTGRTSSIEKSRAIALLEAIERYGGFVLRSKKTLVFKSLEELRAEGASMIDMRRLMLNQDSASNRGPYKNKKFYFYPDQRYHWVYGYDITNNRSLLVPEAIAYYGLKLKGSEYYHEIFAYEISNGCSVGADLTEAVYNGMLEVLERDAFLSCWYTDRSITRIVLDSGFLSEENGLRTEYEIFRNFYSDYDIDIYEISCQCHIHVVLMTVTRKEICSNKMNFMCAAAADENIIDAAQKAMHEISSIFIGLQERFEEEYESIAEKAMDMSLVADMEDHSLVWGYYKNLDKIHFKEQAADTRTMSELIASQDSSPNLNSSFARTIDELRSIGKEIVFVDQTTEEMRSIGMACAKCLITGLIPMTFGAANVRISDERIKEIEKAEKRKINVRFIPHPFP